MDIHVMDNRDVLGTRVIGDDQEEEEEEEEDSEPDNGNADDESSAPDDDGNPEPYVGMEFHSDDVAKTFYEDYARKLGFTARIGHCSRLKPITRDLVCGKEGSKKKSAENCDALLRIQLMDNGKWVVTKFVKEHSHLLASNGTNVHYLNPQKRFAGAAEKTMPKSYQGVNIVPSGMMYVSVDGNRATSDTNVRGIKNMEPTRLAKNSGPANYVVRNTPANHRRKFGKDAQNMLDYFKKTQAENPGFFYAVQLDDDNRMANVFWADARSRTAYTHFGDTVTLDTMYRVNQYRVPFAPFTGVNHHGQTILFGCALLLDDSEATFIWLFKAFLTAMNDRQPVSITTDQDKAIQAAVTQIFPQTRHCISRWHVLREGQEKLAHVCHAHPNFQAELYNCINLTETIEEFEFSWNSILETYNLRGHEWLRSIYIARAQWVPVYFRNSFFAAISPNKRFDDSFFEGYVNQQTTVPLFFRQYERALENWFESEIEADFDTVCTNPVLRTPSPMEKQAANFYTKKIFVKFQEELVETFVYTANRIEGDGACSTFQVAKYEDDHKAYIVTLNYPELRANCSCQMFEYSGILCRHILTVFTVTNVLTLPAHYILRRWTRNAKSEIGLDEHTGELQSQETLTSRYNNLCKEAIKYAEEGSIAIETYNVAMACLKEGERKVSIVKKNVAKVMPPGMQTSSIGYDDRKASTSALDNTTPSLWPRQDEMTKRFNLNDSDTADVNLPRMGPVSLHRDEGAPENAVVLPCLKTMTWAMENKNSTPGNRVAVINLKLQDYGKTPSAELEVKFQLSRVTLEPMLKSMAYISEQLSTPANRVAVINLKLQDAEATSGESQVKFQVSRDTLAAMLRSMAYIREQLSNGAETPSESKSKKLRR